MCARFAIGAGPRETRPAAMGRNPPFLSRLDFPKSVRIAPRVQPGFLDSCIPIRLTIAFGEEMDQ